jgi:uncharacterized membrane protein
MNAIYTSSYFKSLCICDINSEYLHTKQTKISQKQSEHTKIFKISYYIISEVLKNEMIKIIVELTFPPALTPINAKFFAIATSLITVKKYVKIIY